MHHEIPVGKYLLLALMSSWLLEAMMMTGVQGNLATAGGEARVGRVLTPTGVADQVGDCALIQYFSHKEKIAYV